MSATDSPERAGPPLDRPGPGWYRDPSGRYEVRWWTGLGWSGHVRQGNANLFAPMPGSRPDGDSGDVAADELAHLEYVEHFLDLARRNAVVGKGPHDALVRRVAAMKAPLIARLLAPAQQPTPGQQPAPGYPAAAAAGLAAPVLPPGALVPPPRAQIPPPQARPEAGLAARSAPAVARPERRPRALRAAQRWSRTASETVRSDLAVNGLAYLGVLLLFAGLFGVVAFSFNSVRVEFRPVAEAVVPVAVFGSGWLLARRRLVTPARALVLVGGLLLPVGALAAFADGAPVPPDLTGVPLVLALTAVSAVVAVAYWAWGRRQPSSPLRHLVAPALWLTVAMAALGWYQAIPGGRDIVIPGAGQFAAVLVAITLTLAVSRSRVGRKITTMMVFPAGLIALGIAVFVEGLTAGVAGWPAVPVAVSGAAVALALELSDRQIHLSARVVLQGLVVGLTALALEPALGAGWAGATAAVASIAVIERALRRSVSGYALLVPIVVTVAGLAFAGFTPWALLIASAAVSGWAQARRLWPGGWPYPVVLLTVAAAAAPAGVLAGLVGALPAGPGVAGLALLAGTVCVRVTAGQADRFWQWWIPAAAVAVLAATTGQTATAWFVVAAAAATATIAISTLPGFPRVWLTGAAALWTAWLVFEVTDLGFPARMITITGAALVAVAFAAWRHDASAGHVGLFGHLAGLACWPLAAVDAGRLDAAAPTAVLGLVVTGAVLTTVAQEAGRAAVPDLLVRCARTVSRGLPGRLAAAVEVALRQVPAVAATVLLIPFAADLLAPSGFSEQRPWWPVGLTAVGLAYLLLARLPHLWQRVARVLADVGAWATVLAAAGCQHRDPALVAIAAVMAAPALQAPALRRRAAIWLAWAASVPFAVLAADLAGLPASYWYAVTLGWGAVLLIGGLVADDVKEGRRQPGEWVRVGWLFRPVAVGSTACAVGLIGSSGGFPHQAGWTLIAAGAVVIAAGVLLKVGGLGAAGAVLAVCGLGAALPRSLWDRPWLLLVVAAILLVTADVTRPRESSNMPLWQRWDLPLFAVAHATALVAVAFAVATGTAVAATTVGCGALAVAVAARWRRWPWAVGGAVLILAGAADAGAGWATLAFAAQSVMATALAAGRQRRLSFMLHAAGALAAMGAWAAGLVWRDVTVGTAVSASSVASGALVLLAAVGVRIWTTAQDWARAWGCAAIVLAGVAAAALSDPATPSGDGLFVAAGLAATAIGCGLAAGPLAVALLREAAAVVAVAAALAWAYGISADLTAVAWGAVVAGLAASGILLAPWTRRAAPVWVRPTTLVGIGATGVAIGAGAAALPDVALLVPAFVLSAALIVALAVAFRRPVLSVAAPVPLCAAWLAYASQALTGQPQWFSVPVGAAIIAVAGLLRSARRADGRPVGTPDVVALEITGMGMMMGASLVQAVTRGSLYGLIGVGIALALIGWGALTRVRRRLLGGTIAFGASLLLLIVVPLAPAVPHLGGAAVWLALAGAGVVAIFAAALLDVTRAAARRGVAKFADLTRDWE